MPVNNCSNATFAEDFKEYSIGTRDVAFAVPFTLNMLLGVTGNTLVIAVVKRTRSMHTTTNFLLVNLAVGDIMVLVWNPRWISFLVYPVHPRGALGDFVCEVYTGNAIITVLVSVSILSLVVLAIERYNALVNALQSRRIRNETLPYVIAAIWLLAVLFSIPDFMNNYFSEKYKKCLCPFSLELATSVSKQIICTITLLGFLPFFILSFCYFQILKGLFVTNTICSEREASFSADNLAKKKLAKISLSVTCVYYVCFIPYAVFLIFLASVKRELIVRKQEEFSIILKSCEFFVTLSSSINPAIYAFQSTSYRQGFRNIWNKQRRRRQEPLPLQNGKDENAIVCQNGQTSATKR